MRGVERGERINHYAKLLLFPSLAEKAPGKKCSKIRRVASCEKSVGRSRFQRRKIFIARNAVTISRGTSLQRGWTTFPPLLPLETEIKKKRKKREIIDDEKRNPLFSRFISEIVVGIS